MAHGGAQATEQEDVLAAGWSHDIEARIGESLRRLASEGGDKLSAGRRQRISDLHSVWIDDDESTVRRLAADSLARWLSALMGEKQQQQQQQTEELEQQEANLRRPDIRRFLKHNRVSLFTCLASTTYPLLLVGAPNGTNEGEPASISDMGLQQWQWQWQRDKLARIRPAYRSILVARMGKLVSSGAINFLDARSFARSQKTQNGATLFVRFRYSDRSERVFFARLLLAARTSQQWKADDDDDEMRRRN